MIQYKPMEENPAERERIMVGDVVKYARHFLQSTGMYTGAIPFAEGEVTSIRQGIASINWNTEEAPPRVNIVNLVRKDRLHLESNPGDVHIDIGSHNAAPGASYDWSERKNPDDIKRSNNAMMKMLMSIPRVKYAEVGRMGTGAYFYEVEWDNGAISRNQGFRNGVDLYFGVKAFVKSYTTKRNPPLPASALMDITTAKTTAREVEAGQRPLGNLGTVDHLLDRSLQKLRGSHMGAVDWQNPPEGGEKIRGGFWSPDKNLEEVLTSDRNFYGFVLARHAGKHLKLLIDVTTDKDGLRISARIHEPQGINQVGDVISAASAMIGNDGQLKSFGKSYQENPGPGRIQRYKTKYPQSAVEIYRDIVEIKAIKRDGKRYVHKFGLGSEILGMPDGSILIRSRKGKRLWKNFKVEG